MSDTLTHAGLLEKARQVFVETFIRGLKPLLDAVVEGAHRRAEEPAERAEAQRRNDVMVALHRLGGRWPVQIEELLRERLNLGPEIHDSTTSALVKSMQAGAGRSDLSLVDDSTVQRDIVLMRLSLAIADKCTWELADLRARVMQLDGVDDFEVTELFRPQVVGRCVIKAWEAAGLEMEAWRSLEAVIQSGIVHRAEEAYHEVNRWLIERGVLPDVDLRPFLRRTDGTPTTLGGLAAGAGDDAAASSGPASQHAAVQQTASAAAAGATGVSSAASAAKGGFLARAIPASWRNLFPGGGVAAAPSGGFAPTASSASAGAATTTTTTMGRRALEDETRMMTRAAEGMARADVLLEQFGQIMERHLPGFRDTSTPRPASEKLAQAMVQAQQHYADQVEAAGAQPGGGSLSPEQVLHDLRQRSQALKQSAETPVERATVELVALLFQSILTDDRIPAHIRVWFARLQMPVLRVALAEPDFFSTTEHPARRLIDRMGACVMGFEGDSGSLGPELEAEIKRVVQVVEAFPDTGRRVFQTVLDEFEKFLENYYKRGDATTRMGISLAQQVEQRETLAIQYTIELRKLLNDLPTHEGVRDFLFHIWADVLATLAVRHGVQSEEVRDARTAATDLVWVACAKTTREERAEVIRRLPSLLETLRRGMSTANVAPPRQEEAIKQLNLAFTAAFGARSATLSAPELEQLKEKLEAIEEMIPDDDFEIDESWVLDESNHQSDGLEVVGTGGSMPGPQAIEMVNQLQLGAVFKLENRGHQETVRLVWQGMQRQLALFVNNTGHCLLFQRARLAAFLQAGLLLPAQTEALTVTATREALNKIQANPARLLN